MSIPERGNITTGKNLESLWASDHIGIALNDLCKVDKLVMKDFKNNTIILFHFLRSADSGRAHCARSVFPFIKKKKKKKKKKKTQIDKQYVVRLLWKEWTPKLPANFGLAMEK